MEDQKIVEEFYNATLYTEEDTIKKSRSIWNLPYLCHLSNILFAPITGLLLT